MNKLFSLLPLAALFAFGCVSCSDANDDIQNLGEEREVRIVLGGEYVQINEEPMGRSRAESKKTYYGINIYRKHKDVTGDYKTYLYGVFDDPAKIIFTAQKDCKYKFECTTFEEDRLKLARFKDGLSHPFEVSVGISENNNDNSKKYSLDNLNTFISSTAGENLHFIGNGNTVLSVAEDEDGYTTDFKTKTQPSGIRYYGELEGYSIGSSDQQVELKLKNASIAIKIKAEIPDGKVTWYDRSTALDFEDAIMTPEDNEKIYYFTLPNVKGCWADADKQSQWSNIVFEWTREYGGSAHTVETNLYEFKRNFMTTSTLNFVTGDQDINFSITQEEEFKEKSTIDLNF